MRTLVIGGTGTVGSQVVRKLLERGVKVRVLTHSPEKQGDLPKGVEPAIGDLRDKSTLPRHFEDVESVFLVTAMAQDETAQGLRAVDAAEAAGVRHFVYMSVHKLDTAPQIPHFRSKIPIEDAVKQSGMRYTILRPNHFFQNDRWFRDAIVNDGVYPEPIGNVGLNRVDVRDIADAAVNAITLPGHGGRTYPLVGPDTLTGEDVAKTYSRLLGREVRYAGNDLDAFVSHARAMMPDWLVQDLKIMYDHVQKNGLRATQAELDEQAEVLGHAPRRFEEFVAELVPAWKGMAAAR